MSAFIQMAIAGALCGFVVGRFLQKLLQTPQMLILLALGMGLLLSQLAVRLPPRESYWLYCATADLVCGIVIIVLIGSSDDDFWKRFRKKTSKALEKLLAKVKELAPTPAPKPFPA